MPYWTLVLCTTCLAMSMSSSIVRSPDSVRVVITGPAQELLVVEEHARLGVLRDPVAAVWALRRFPERREDRAKMLGVSRDVVIELEHEAIGLERADPFMRRNERVRTLADPEDLQELQRIVVEARRRAFAHHNLHALGRALGRELLVQPLRCLHHIAGTQRSRRVLARPELELHSVLRKRSRRRDDRRSGAARQCGCCQQRHFSGLPVEHRRLPSLCDAFHRAVVLCYCTAVERDYEGLRCNDPARTGRANGQNRAGRRRRPFRAHTTGTRSNMPLSLLAREAGRVQICGHRGYSLHYPENTLPAFQAAKSWGATMIEIDVVLTADGEPTFCMTSR